MRDTNYHVTIIESTLPADSIVFTLTTECNTSLLILAQIVANDLTEKSVGDTSALNVLLDQVNAFDTFMADGAFLIPPDYRLNKEMVVPMDTKRHEAHTEALHRIRLASKNCKSRLSLTDLALERLPEEMNDLTALTALRVESTLTDIGALSNLTALEILSLSGCNMISSFPPLNELVGLKCVSLYDASVLDCSLANQPLAS